MFKRGVRLLLLSGTATIAATGVAHAQSGSTGTAAGTTISNQAQASYTVNGTPQTTQSNVASFKVDRKVNFTVVAAQSAPTSVDLGQTDRVTTFTVTNLTNGAQDFILDPDQQNLSVGILPGTDNFDMANLKAYVDSNGNGQYDAGVDTAQYIDELAPNQSVTVFIVGDVPNRDDAALAFVSLHVIAAAGDAPGSLGAALVPTDLNIVDQDNEVDIVFADDDSDGAFAGDIARNGQGRAYAAYQVTVRNVDLAVFKSARVVSDGVSTLNPKALPGATIEYCLSVTNNSTVTAADQVTLTDVVPAGTTYVPGSIRMGPAGVAGQCIVNPVAEDDDADDAGETDPYRGSFDAAANKVTASVSTLIGGGRVAASFQVLIN